ncbi:MAG TPA: hypothetical protein VIJ62_07325 [Rhizomicrobium sp.]
MNILRIIVVTASVFMFSGMSANLSAQIEDPVGGMAGENSHPVVTPLPSIQPIAPMPNISPPPAPIQVVPPPLPQKSEEHVDCGVVRNKCQQICYPLPNGYSTYEKCIRAGCHEVREDCVEELVRDLQGKGDAD